MPSVHTQPSVHSGPSRSTSPSPSRQHHQEPSEITNLLAPGPAPATPGPAFQNHSHLRKASVGGRSVSGRSVAGSIHRGYGSVNSKPGPASQAPRVSKLGQRRILTTWPIQISFFALVTMVFLSFCLTLILWANTFADLNVSFLPNRGSGFGEFWLSVVGTWIGVGGLLFFSHPAYLFFLTTLISAILHIPIFLLLWLSPALRHRHVPFFLVPFCVTAATVFCALLANYLVRRARRLESDRIFRMLSDAAERQQEENRLARAWVGSGGGAWARFVDFVIGVLELVAGLVGLIVVALLLIDISISAYDSSLPLPSPHSQLVSVKPASSPWPIRLHVACSDPPNSNRSMTESALNRPFPRKHMPTVLYEGASGVPGSLALLDFAPIPSGEDSVLPGKWIYDMQEEGKLGRVCVWDRPGYGFSEVLGGADLGNIAESLWLALDKLGEHNELAVVGEGFGGLVARVFAASRPERIHSLLHLDAQTAQTYFNEPPNNPITTFIHRLTTRLIPGLLTPLSLTRFPTLLLRRSNSLSRILASTYPAPSTAHLSETLQKARLQESFNAHSHTSSSFRTLLRSGKEYPASKPAIVISSLDRMNKVDGWEEGQRGLAEEVTSDEGLVEWIKVPDVGHWVCEGDRRPVCEKALRKLLNA